MGLHNAAEVRAPRSWRVVQMWLAPIWRRIAATKAERQEVRDVVMNRFLQKLIEKVIAKHKLCHRHVSIARVAKPSSARSRKIAHTHTSHPRARCVNTITDCRQEGKIRVQLVIENRGSKKLSFKNDPPTLRYTRTWGRDL